jgi:hypothetical protein
LEFEARGDDILRTSWNEVWAVGHLSVLANMDSRDVITELPAEAPERGGANNFARGWCARAWLIGGTHPLSSNIVCWPARG